jgi:phage tail-like protein
MADFPNNTHRYDPYANFMFHVRDEANNIVAGVSRVSPLRRSTAVITHRSGGMNSYVHKSPGLTTYDAVTLERGLTQDEGFAEWAMTVHSPASTADVDLVNYKRTLTLEVLNIRKQVALRYELSDCWVSEFVGSPDLDAGSGSVAIESIRLEMEYWTRDLLHEAASEAADVPAE